MDFRCRERLYEIARRAFIGHFTESFALNFDVYITSEVEGYGCLHSCLLVCLFIPFAAYTAVYSLPFTMRKFGKILTARSLDD